MFSNSHRQYLLSTSMRAASASMLAVAMLVFGLLHPGAASAVDSPAAPSLQWDSDGFSGYVGQPVTVSGTYDGLPDGAVVSVQYRDGDTYVPGDAVVSASAGRFAGSVVATETVMTVRAVAQVGAEIVAVSPDVDVAGRPGPSVLALRMPSSAKDYQTVVVSAAWSASYGEKPRAGVKLQFKKAGGKAYRSVATMWVRDGRGSTTIKPREDGQYRLVSAATARLRATTSRSVRFDNRPPGRVVTLPKGSSRPTVKVPLQARASRARADARVYQISDAVWASMKGRTWHKGCPVGRSSLRLVRVNYWAFDGYVRRGEIVVNTSVSGRVVGIFSDLFALRAPIRSMYRVDRFGYSTSLRGGDDLRSMRADNTSGFNCRRVVGATRFVSPHSYGRSIDINPWENPYASASGYKPNKSWAKRTNPTAITYRGTKDPVVKVFKKRGFRWLGRADLQHFQRG